MIPLPESNNPTVAEVDTLRQGRGAVEDAAEADAMLARLTGAMFDAPSDALRLGRYRLERKLGQGAFGVVYLAHDPDLDRRVAVKALRPRSGMTEVVKQRFFREARVLGSVLDPGLAAVFDVGSAPAAGALGLGSDDDEVFYIVMEYVAGTDLSNWITAERRSWRHIVSVFLQAGRGLAAAHDRDIVHRDFKPSNVLMGEDGSVKVADFGLAQALGSLDEPEALSAENLSDSDWSGPVDDATLTKTGVALGTPVFMAPEQHAGGRVGPAADQFAFCVALYYALAGRYPFRRGPILEMWSRKQAGEIEPWPTQSPVPQWVRSVVERGLKVEPGARFENMRALLSRLEKSPARRLAQASSWVLLPAALAGGAYAVVDTVKPASIDVAAASSAGEPLRGLSVAIDGTPVESVGDPLRLRAGQYLLEVSADDHEPVARALDVKAGGDYRFDVELARHQGILDVTAVPDAARIYIDGVDHGSRLRDFGVSTGTHTIEVKLDGHFSRSFTWTLERDQRREAYVALAEANVWSFSSPPPNVDVQWLPDTTGDGRDELLVVRGGLASVLDPWVDAVVADFRIAESYHPQRKVADVDHDGTPEYFAYAATDDARSITAWTLDAAGVEVPRWSHAFEGHGDVLNRFELLIPREGPATAMVLDAQTLRAYRAADGTLLWTQPAPGVERMIDGAGQALLMREGSLQAVGPDAHVRWLQTLPAEPVMLGDLDDDGFDDFATLHEGTVTLYAGSTGRARWNVSPPAAERLSVVRDAHDVAQAVLAGSKTSVTMLEPSTGRAGKRLDGQLLRSLSLDRRTLVATLHEDTVRIFDVATAAEVFSASREDARALEAGDFNGNGVRELMLMARDGTMRFYSERFEPLATLDLSTPASRVVDLRDANNDGAQDVLLENNLGLFVVEGAKRQWALPSQHSMRAPPLRMDGPDGPRVVVTLEREGQRQLARVDGRTGKLELTPLSTGGDLHREAVLVDEGGDTFAYFTSSSGMQRVRLSDGAEVGRVRLGGQVYATASVADVDADGGQEVLLGRFGKGVPEFAVYSTDLSTVKATVPMEEFTWSKIVPVDIDADGTLEVLAFGLQGAVEAFDPADGWSRRWVAHAGGRINFAGAVVGAASAPRLAVSTMGHGDAPDDLVILDLRDGRILQRHRGWGARGSTPLGFDADRDGVVDLYASDTAGTLRRFEDDMMTPVWARTVVASEASLARSSSSPMASGQLRLAGPPVIVTTWRDGTVVVVDALRGETLWRTSVEARVEGRPLLTDVDGDGEAEVVVATHAGELICLRGQAPSWQELRGEIGHSPAP